MLRERSMICSARQMMDANHSRGAEKEATVLSGKGTVLFNVSDSETSGGGS